MDIGLFDNRLFKTFKWFMGNKSKSVGIVDQRIASDAAGGLIGLAEAAVDDQQPAAPLHGALPFLGLDGDVAVDDVAVGALQAELPQQRLADLRVVVELVVDVFGLGPGGLVGEETPLKGGHAVAAEDGAVAARPQEPQEVHAGGPLRRAGGGVVGPAGGQIRIVQEGLAGETPPVHREGEEGAVGRHGDAAVEEQVAVEDFIQAALGVEEADVPLELLAVEKGEGELVDQDLLLGGEGVGIGGVDGGEVGVQHCPSRCTALPPRR